MGNKLYILNSEQVSDNIDETIYVDSDEGKICKEVRIRYNINSDDLVEFFEDLKLQKEKEGFDNELIHSFIKNVECDGCLLYDYNAGDTIVFKCECGESVSWSWEEFCRYYDCR